MKKRIMDLYKQLISEGNLIEASKILRFLIDKIILLGLNDIDWDINEKLLTLGLKEHITANGNCSKFYL